MLSIDDRIGDLRRRLDDKLEDLVASMAKKGMTAEEIDRIAKEIPTHAKTIEATKTKLPSPRRKDRPSAKPARKQRPDTTCE